MMRLWILFTLTTSVFASDIVCDQIAQSFKSPPMNVEISYQCSICFNTDTNERVIPTQSDNIQYEYNWGLTNYNFIGIEAQSSEIATTTCNTLYNSGRMQYEDVVMATLFFNEEFKNDIYKEIL